MGGRAVIVAGFGFRSAATQASLASALARAGGVRPDWVATVADKAGAAVFRAFAAGLGCPAVGVDAARLAEQVTLTHSAASLAARGTGSVAEAAALSAAGQGARLIGPRVVSDDGCATCALAQGEGP